jgi:hypothetical protein
MWGLTPKNIKIFQIFNFIIIFQNIKKNNGFLWNFKFQENQKIAGFSYHPLGKCAEDAKLYNETFFYATENIFTLSGGLSDENIFKLSKIF